MNRFYGSVADVLETGSVDGETRFRETPGWCSLKGFGLLVLLENDWGARVPLERFLTLETCRDLWREAFLALAARVFSVPRETLGDGCAYGDPPQWDSVNHLRLVMEAEKAFGVSYPLERIPALRASDDFLVDGEV